MRKDKNGKIFLEKGEIVPCECGKCHFLYTPEKGTLTSRCPTCSHINIHDQQEFRRVKKGS